MASAPNPSPATCQSTFEQGVALALHLWPALTLAVQNGWGGPDSADKRDWFAGAVVELFPDVSALTPAQLQQRLRQRRQQQHQQQSQPTSHQNDANNSGGGGGGDDDGEEPDQEDLEAVLLQVMLDEFEVNVEDDSAYEVAQQVVRLRGECLRGRFEEVEALRRRWESRKGSKVMFKHAEDQADETDWDTDEEGNGDEDEEGDVEMDEAPALVREPARREKEAAEVDEDGFTKVTGTKR